MLFTEFDRKSVRENATLNTLTAWVDAVKMVLTLMLSLIFVSLIQLTFFIPLEYLFGLCNKFTTPYTGYR